MSGGDSVDNKGRSGIDGDRGRDSRVGNHGLSGSDRNTRLGNQDGSSERFVLLLKFGQFLSLDDLFSVQFSDSAIGHASEGNLLGNQLSWLGGTLGTALGHRDSGETNFIHSFEDHVFVSGALANQSHEALVNFGGDFSVLGALLSFSFKLFFDGTFKDRALGRVDSVGSNLDFGLGEDALLGSRNISESLVVEVSADTTQLVLHQRAGFNIKSFSIEFQFNVERGSSEFNDGVLGLVKFNDNGLSGISNGFVGILFKVDFSSVDNDSDFSGVLGVRSGRSHDNFSLVQVNLDFLVLGVSNRSRENSKLVLGRAVSRNQVEAVIQLQRHGLVVEGGKPVLFHSADRQLLSKVGADGGLAGSGSHDSREQRKATRTGRLDHTAERSSVGALVGNVSEGNSFFRSNDGKIKSIREGVKVNSEEDFSVLSKVRNTGNRGIIMLDIRPQQSLGKRDNLSFIEGKRWRSVDVLDLVINFINNLSRQDGLFTFIRGQSSRNLSSDELFTFLGNGGFLGIGLLLGGNLIVSDEDNLRFFTGMAKSNG